MNLLIFATNKFRQAALLFIVLTAACTGTSTKSTMKKEEKGTYGFDVEFLRKHQLKTIELSDSQTDAKVLLAPGLQGRVLTSSAQGNQGKSFGWLNYKLFESGKISPQFNPFGGEERFWLGPEGGPFSIYFQKDQEQSFENWLVPKEFDTVPYDITSQSSSSVSFKKDFSLVNASGTPMEIEMNRTVRLLSQQEVSQTIGIAPGDSLRMVAYETENTLINKGKNEWNEQTGFLSVWMLSMFNPSEKGVVFIPYLKGSEEKLGTVVTDDYFGKVPSDRLKLTDGLLFFKVDGKFRSKIGISPQRALPFCGSYDPDTQTLTLLWCTLPENQMKYVNSKWGKQSDPLCGDAINSYNDGPVEDGSIMGPFYEIESSSPAAMLRPGEKMIHTQRILHITGSESQLNLITEKLFNTRLPAIKEAFK